MEKRKPPAAGMGRVKGVPNKFTADLKEMILGALNAKDGGGQAYLQRQADENPVAFMGLVGKLLPKDVNATHTIHHDPAELSDGELAAIIHRAAASGNGVADPPPRPAESSKLH